MKMIKNPLTNRNIKKNGPTYKKLITAGYKERDGILIKIESCIPFVFEIYMYILSYLPLKDILLCRLINRESSLIIPLHTEMYQKQILMYLHKRITLCNDRYTKKILQYANGKVSLDLLHCILKNIERNMTASSPYQYTLIAILTYHKSIPGVEEMCNQFLIKTCNKTLKEVMADYGIYLDKLIEDKNDLIGIEYVKERIRRDIATLNDIDIMRMHLHLNLNTRVTQLNRHLVIQELKQYI